MDTNEKRMRIIINIAAGIGVLGALITVLMSPIVGIAVAIVSGLASGYFGVSRERLEVLGPLEYVFIMLACLACLVTATALHMGCTISEMTAWSQSDRMQVRAILLGGAVATGSSAGLLIGNYLRLKRIY